MDQRLQEAIDAAKSGDAQEAQRMLAQLLKEDPDQVHAWFLLSHLVESEEKQTAYLSKVLSLDPAHEQARQRLALLRGAAPAAEPVAVAETQPAMAVAPELMDAEVQARGDTLPSWMSADDAAAVIDPDSAATEAEAGVSAVEEALPDWLQEPLDSDWTDEEEDTTTPVAGAAAPHPTMALATPPQKEIEQVDTSRVRRLNLTLILLLILAFLIAFLMFQEIMKMQ